MGHMYTKTKFIVYLKFQFNWAFSIVFGDPLSHSPTQLPSGSYSAPILGSPQFVRRICLAVATVVASTGIPSTKALSSLEEGELSLVRM